MNQPAAAAHTLRVATYNIHKGVQGIGPARRLEIHNLGHAIEQLDADIICLQEVRKDNRKEESFFNNWPEQNQADFLTPLGYTAAYRTNATTRWGEHGNALLTRWPILESNHRDISDHRFEQRGLLHVAMAIAGQRIHTIVVHLGLVQGSRLRQTAQIHEFIKVHVPDDEPVIVAGDFNDWGFQVKRMLAGFGLFEYDEQPLMTYPSRLPVVQLDHVYARGLTPCGLFVPRGRIWWRMSDHLPLIAEFRLRD